MSNKTPLLDEHRDLGASFTDFAGWQMPLAGLAACSCSMQPRAPIMPPTLVPPVFVSDAPLSALLHSHRSSCARVGVASVLQSSGAASPVPAAAVVT